MNKKIFVGNTCTRYKLFKKGKSWVAMGVTTLSISLGLGMLMVNPSVRADTSSTANSATSSAANSVTSSAANSVTSSAANSVTSSAANSVTSSAANSVTSSAANSATSSAANSATSSAANSATSSAANSATSSAANSATSSAANSATSSAVNSATSISAAKAGVSNVKLATDNLSSSTDTTGVVVTSSFNNGDTFSGGGGVIALNTSIEKSATISNGTKLTFTISNPKSINWDNIQLNGGTNYGSLAYDKTSGTITYTFSTDISNAGINFIINLHTAAVDTSKNIITASLNNTSVAITGGTSYNTKANAGGSGGSGYDNQRLIIGNGSYGYIGINDNYVGYINGKNYYLPDMQSMNFNVVVDPGFYTNSQNDKIGRTITLSISGTGASLQADNIYITEKGGFPNTSKSYVPLSSVGWTTTQIDDQTVKISIPDNMDIGWYVLGIVATTPGLNSQYILTDQYESDYITTAQKSTTSGYFQNINNSGFVPKITAMDKNIKQGTTVSDINKWLLDGVTASDVEDGNLSSAVTIKDDTNFVNAWNSNKNGVYTIIYTVTDSDGNTVTQSVSATIYSDITIHYIDKNGTELSAQTTSMANSVGSNYNIIPTSLIKKNGVSYYYVSSNNNLSGIYGENNQPTDIYLTYDIDQTSIDTKDSTLVAGPSTTWKAADNFVSATDEAGSALKLSDITVSGTVDPTKAGRYEVTYSYTDAAGNAVTKTATITVVASQASIDTKDSTLVAGPSTTWKAADNFVSATDEAGSALKLSDITVSGTVDPTKAGRYEVTYSYTDAAGNAVTKTATITVVASQASIDTKDSTLVAGPSTTWKAADNFVSATDEAGSALKLSDITVSGTVDPTKAGRYEVTYSYTDAAGNTVTKTATITVVASQASIDTKDSTLVAGPSTTWKAADNFVSATDEAGGALKLSDITVSGTVDPTKAGRYEVTYSYTDAAGNTVTKTATITVVASQASIDTKDSTLVAGPSTTWKAADNFVSATDEAGGALKLSDITVSGTVDPTKAGRYEVTYSYTDAAGNAVTKTATITVVASQASIDTKDSTLVAGPSTTWKAADNFVSATDEAGSVLKLSDITVSGTVDPTKAGRYEVTYSYTDAAGNAAVTKTATITVVASQASIDTKDSTLVAGPSTTWKAADNFVSATDEAGSVLKLSDITVSGTVDPTKAGRYEVTYSYTDAAGNAVTKTATITVVASQASIDTKDSTLVAGPSTTWKAADNFVSATDEAGSVLKLSDITVSGTVDPTKAGRYEVTYSYTDAAGNAVTKTATITVVASQASIDTKDSTLVAGPSTTWKAADNFVSATDEAGSVLKLSDITVSGTVDPTKAGRYEVTYSYTDAAGNVVTKTATITVIVKSNPVTPGKPSQPAKPVSPVTPDQTNQSAKSDQRAKSDHLTTFSQVTSVKSGSALQTTTSHNELPQTDESTQRTMTLGGLLLLVTTSLLTFLGGKKRRNQD
ncbi:bacterial Ig-like domain-containing protein [Lactiplantibacillus plantarum]|nr:bacterial Ig-like domain-containing protein [Lactiplantibacillus plantarum]WHQ48539.1 bacterial Ig-like domain-containing protein [Lactiplantibacillus plantarum]